MEKADIVIIGAGVVGLVIAWHISSLKKEIVFLERHDCFGCEASSHNSERYQPLQNMLKIWCMVNNDFFCAIIRVADDFFLTTDACYAKTGVQ